MNRGCVDVSVEALTNLLAVTVPEEQKGAFKGATVTGCAYLPERGVVRFYLHGEEMPTAYEGAAAERVANVTTFEM